MKSKKTSATSVKNKAAINHILSFTDRGLWKPIHMAKKKHKATPLYFRSDDLKGNDREKKSADTNKNPQTAISKLKL
ncbi:hypothetical protein [Scatolibacter rhodanostii]|uniref:hypothetical protein n=1 Tax=Scatolibacter rhodanostii TaxID=2014781 RepID=UPI001FA8DBD5|nr:hypothetical protein [Scatolibacter rhodanostii]